MTSSQPLSLSLPWRLALAVLAGILLALSYDLHPQAWAAWLVPVALIPAASGSARHAWLVGAIAGAIGMAGVFAYYVDLAGLGVAIMILVLRALSWALAARLAEVSARRLPVAVAVLVLPAVLAALEWITLATSVHGAAGSLAYSQMDAIPVIQVASLGGVPAVVFIVLLPGSLLGLWLIRRTTGKELAIAASLVGLIAVATGGYAAQRLNAPVIGKSVAVTLLASDDVRGSATEWAPLWKLYGPHVLQSGRGGGLVVLPEKIALLDRPQAEQAAGDIATAARPIKATVVVGLEIHDGRAYYNRAVIASPDGQVRWYDKQRMVPGFEDRDRPGTTPAFTAVDTRPVGVAICKDMHIPSIGREYAGQAGLMAVPAWDFGQDGWMGARMTVMRGIENGYAIARSARHGLVGAYDARGRVIAEQPSHTGMTVVTVVIPGNRVQTLYSLIGEVFGQVCVGMVAILITANLIVWRKQG